MQNLPRLLLIDDDRSIANALALALRDTYEVDIAVNGERALFKINNQQYAAIILDLNLPDFSGMEVCQQLRNRGVTAPILVVTGESAILTKINLLDAGANDYLTKPFSLGELKARLRVLTRYTGDIRPIVQQITVGSLMLDRQTHTVMRQNIVINLRRKEFALLECLMEHAGNVVSRAALTRHAWHGLEEPWTNTVDVHLKYLRDKFDRPFEQPLIQTVHGIGYRLAHEISPMPDEKMSVAL